MKGTVLCNIRFEHYSTVQQEKAFSVEPDQPSQIPSKPAQAGFIFAINLPKEKLWIHFYCHALASAFLHLQSPVCLTPG